MTHRHCWGHLRPDWRSCGERLRPSLKAGNVKCLPLRLPMPCPCPWDCCWGLHQTHTHMLKVRASVDFHLIWPFCSALESQLQVKIQQFIFQVTNLHIVQVFSLQCCFRAVSKKINVYIYNTFTLHELHTPRSHNVNYCLAWLLVRVPSPHLLL